MLDQRRTYLLSYEIAGASIASVPQCLKHSCLNKPSVWTHNLYRRLHLSPSLFGVPDPDPIACISTEWPWPRPAEGRRRLADDLEPRRSISDLRRQQLGPRLHHAGTPQRVCRHHTRSVNIWTKIVTLFLLISFSNNVNCYNECSHHVSICLYFILKPVQW